MTTTTTQPTKTFGDQLREMENELRNQHQITSQEISYIVKEIKEKALKAVKERQTHVIYHLDDFRSKPKPQLLKGGSATLEMALHIEGLYARYEEDLGCGQMCSKRNCPDKTHWGYVISWPQPEK